MGNQPGGAAFAPGRGDAFAWRLVGTGLSFALFGIVGVVLGVAVVPLLMLLPGSAHRRQRRVRSLVRFAFRAFIGFMRLLGVLTYELRGFERLGRPGQLVIANHPSLIDVVFLLAFIPGAGCVVKRALWRNPAMAFVVHGAGYVPNQPTELMIRRAAAALDEGQALVMFPEGTRTSPGRPLRFHRGAASVAVRAAHSLTPVFITVEPTTLTKGSPWYRIPPRRPHFRLRAGDELDLLPTRGEQPLPLASRTLNRRLRLIYADESPEY
jgi:1-acyl-sn-glycerol-3-phosphate acyltransferase